jgi:uncharacterized protein YprB with RNaseH-like and TPR domain
MNGVFFDIETTDLLNDLENPPGITCAAAYAVGKIKGSKTEALSVWWAGMNQTQDRPNFMDHLANYPDRPLDVPTAEIMEPDEIEQMLDNLVGLLHGPFDGRLFAHNGFQFDFAVMALNLPHRFDEILELALRSYDPCLQMLRMYGWPVGLAKISMAMLGIDKAEGIDGGKATQLWPLDADKVLRYVVGDTKLTHQAYSAIASEKRIRWINSKGGESSKPVNAFHSVRHLLRLPEVDRSWLSDYQGQWELEAITRWMQR